MKVSRGGQLFWQITTPGLGGVTKSSVSPDDKYILNIADGYGYVQLWDVAQRKRLYTQLSPKRQYRLLDAAFTSDSRR